jgi:hypothetical protein
MKLEFSRQIFERDSNIKFHESRLLGADLFYVRGRAGGRAVGRGGGGGQTDGQTDMEANDGFSKFCESA